MSSVSLTAATSSRPASPPSSLMDRLSTWASENKAIVYGIAGTAVVITGAGVVYYLSSPTNSGNPTAASAEKRKTKKERRKEKRAAGGEEEGSNTVKTEKPGIIIPEFPTSSRLSHL
jgi:mitochondrial import receptor subunit TOM70